MTEAQRRFFASTEEERAADRVAFAVFFEDFAEELSWGCPYCGEPDVAVHRLRNHPEMWIGGSNVYGTIWHGWADH